MLLLFCLSCTGFGSDLSSCSCSAQRKLIPVVLLELVLLLLRGG
jgi:hypothetical protein